MNNYSEYKKDSNEIIKEIDELYCQLSNSKEVRDASLIENENIVYVANLHSLCNSIDNAIKNNNWIYYTNYDRAYKFSLHFLKEYLDKFNLKCDKYDISKEVLAHYHISLVKKELSEYEKRYNHYKKSNGNKDLFRELLCEQVKEINSIIIKLTAYFDISPELSDEINNIKYNWQKKHKNLIMLKPNNIKKVTIKKIKMINRKDVLGTNANTKLTIKANEKDIDIDYYNYGYDYVVCLSYFIVFIIFMLICIILPECQITL